MVATKTDTSALRRAVGGLPLICIALLLLLPSHTLAALFPPNSGVLSLDYRSFPSKILQVEKPAIVAFTAPWCGHCQRLTPEFTKAAKNLEGIVHFANVDCDEDKNKQMCSQYEVKGFPTILVFPATKRRIPKTYQGERVAKALVEYAVSTLPHSVKKLKAEELPAWVQGIGPITADGTPDTKGINGRGKVLLLSNKPTSSPLYKSLALDFRKTFDFAFARGDQVAVKGSAKNMLGINVNRDEDLPILVAFPPPTAVSASGESDFEKGKFETYEGQLKMGPLTEWLKSVKAKYDIGENKDDSGSKKTKTKSKAKAGAKKSPSHADTFDEPLPEGGFYEWRPPANDAKQRLSKQAEEIQAKYEAMKKKEKGEKGAADQMAFGERHRVPKKDEPQQVPFSGTATNGSSDDSDSAPPPEPEAPVVPSAESSSASEKVETAADPSPLGSASSPGEEAAEAAEASPSSRGYVYTDGQRADLDALNSLLEEAGAYDLAEKAAHKAGDAVEGVKGSARQVYDSVRKAAAAAVASEGGGEEEGLIDPASAPFTRKRKALLSAFSSWLQDEHPDWEENYSSDFLSATKDVEQLMRDDPEKARVLAEESEVKMLGEFKIDLERMGGEGVLGEGKKKKLEELITLLEGRIAAREAEKRRDEWVEEKRSDHGIGSGGVGGERVIEAIRGLTGDDSRMSDEAAAAVGKHSHDEL